jgi:hypothetical protein
VKRLQRKVKWMKEREKIIGLQMTDLAEGDGPMEVDLETDIFAQPPVREDSAT